MEREGREVSPKENAQQNGGHAKTVITRVNAILIIIQIGFYSCGRVSRYSASRVTRKTQCRGIHCTSVRSIGWSIR